MSPFPERKHFERFFRKAMATTVKWRWGAMHGVLEDLFLPMQAALMTCWSKKVFLRGAVAAGEAGQEHDERDVQQCEHGEAGLNLDLVSSTVWSARWWAYARMLHLLHGAANDFRQWAEGCACHGWLAKEGDDKMSTEARVLQDRCVDPLLLLSGVRQGRTKVEVKHCVCGWPDQSHKESNSTDVV